MSKKSEKSINVIKKTCGVVFWHEANGDVSVKRLAEVFTSFGEKAPEQFGVRNVFTLLEREFGRKSTSNVFLRRVPAAVAKDSRREMLDVLEVRPDLLSVSGRDYEVLGQLWLTKTTGPAATYTLGVSCEHGETELVKDDAAVNAASGSGCGCKVWEYVPRLVQAWFKWRGPEAVLDGANRGHEFRLLYAKYGAISLAEHGRPYYFPSDSFIPWEIVKACGDRVFCLPLNPEAAADVSEVTYRVFFEELRAMEDEVAAWDATTRAATKQRRLEALEDARKRTALYEAVLGEAVKNLADLTDGIESRIMETLLGPAADDADGAADDAAEV